MEHAADEVDERDGQWRRNCHERCAWGGDSPINYIVRSNLALAITNIVALLSDIPDVLLGYVQLLPPAEIESEIKNVKVPVSTTRFSVRRGKLSSTFRVPACA